MLREAQIPLFLWLPAALIFHALTGSGAHHAAEVRRERQEIVAFSREVREVIEDQLKVEIEILDEAPESEKEREAEPKKEQEEEKPPEDEKEEKPEKPPLAAPPPKIQPPKPPPLAKLPIPKPKAPEKPPEPKPEPKVEPPKPKPEVAKKEPEKAKEKEKEKEKAPQKLELPKPDGRIAVINDPDLEKEQKDNPNASRIADHANTVKEETMAQFRSYDQNASKPRGGGEPIPSDDPNPGNAPDDARGFSTHVPGDGDPRAGSENGPEKPSNEPIARSQNGTNRPVPGQAAQAAQKAIKAQEAGKGPAAPDVISGGAGAGEAWSINPDGDGKPLQKGRKGRKGRAGKPYIPGAPGDALAQYSINAFGLIDALGRQHIRREQEKARNTRIARHRGSMKGNSFEKYRAAIENYDPTVKAGNQTSLNAARVPFASYINMMHNRIHPIFADGFLGGLKNLAADDKLSNMKLSAHMELVLDGETGTVVNAGIVRPSGVTAFDVAAISSVYSGGPYGKAPDVIVSPDGKVYVHWEFYRDPYYACTSKFARPYLLKSAPKKDDQKPGPRKPAPRSKERTAAKTKKSDKKKSD